MQEGRCLAFKPSVMEPSRCFNCKKMKFNHRQVSQTYEFDSPADEKFPPPAHHVDPADQAPTATAPLPTQQPTAVVSMVPGQVVDETEAEWDVVHTSPCSKFAPQAANPTRCELCKYSVELHSDQRGQTPALRPGSIPAAQPTETDEVPDEHQALLKILRREPLTLEVLSRALQDINKLQQPRWNCPKRAVFFGKTEAGKSTTANVMCGVPLEAYVGDDQTTRYRIVAGHMGAFEIGALQQGSIGSCTKVMKSVEHPSGTFTIDDLPGDEDTVWKDRITNNVVKHRALHPAHGGSFVPIVPLLTIGYTKTVTVTNGDALRAALEAFVLSVHGDTSDNHEQLYRRNVVTLLTHVPDDMSDEQALTGLNNVLCKISGYLSDRAADLAFTICAWTAQQQPACETGRQAFVRRSAGEEQPLTDGAIVVRPLAGPPLEKRITDAIQSRGGLAARFFHATCSREVREGVVSMEADEARQLKAGIREVVSTDKLEGAIGQIRGIAQELNIQTPDTILSVVLDFRMQCSSDVDAKMAGYFGLERDQQRAIAQEVGGLLSTLDGLEGLKDVTTKAMPKCRHCLAADSAESDEAEARGRVAKWDADGLSQASTKLAQRVNATTIASIKHLQQEAKQFGTVDRQCAALHTLLGSLEESHFGARSAVKKCLKSAEDAINGALQELLAGAEKLRSADPAERREAAACIRQLKRAVPELTEERSMGARQKLKAAVAALDVHLAGLKSASASINNFVLRSTKQTCDGEAFLAQYAAWHQWTHQFEHVLLEVLHGDEPERTSSKCRMEFDELVASLALGRNRPRYQTFRQITVLEALGAAIPNDAIHSEKLRTLMAPLVDMISADFNHEQKLVTDGQAALQPVLSKLSSTSDEERNAVEAALRSFFITLDAFATRFDAEYRQIPQFQYSFVETATSIFGLLPRVAYPYELDLQRFEHWVLPVFAMMGLESRFSSLSSGDVDLDKAQLGPLKKRAAEMRAAASTKVERFVESLKTSCAGDKQPNSTSWLGVQRAMAALTRICDLLSVPSAIDLRDTLTQNVLKQWAEAQRRFGTATSYTEADATTFSVRDALDAMDAAAELEKRFPTIVGGESPNVATGERLLAIVSGLLQSAAAGHSSALNELVQRTVRELTYTPPSATSEKVFALVQRYVSTVQAQTDTHVLHATTLLDGGDIRGAATAIVPCKDADARHRVLQACAERMLRLNNGIIEDLEKIRSIPFRDVVLLRQLLEDAPFMEHMKKHILANDVETMRSNLKRLKDRGLSVGRRLAELVAQYNFALFVTEFHQEFPNYGPDAQLDPLSAEVVGTVVRALGQLMVFPPSTPEGEKRFLELVEKLLPFAAVIAVPTLFTTLVAQVSSTYVNMVKASVAAAKKSLLNDDPNDAKDHLDRAEQLAAVHPVAIPQTAAADVNTLRQQFSAMSSQICHAIERELANNMYAKIGQLLLGLAQANPRRARHALSTTVVPAAHALLSAIDAGLRRCVSGSDGVTDFSQLLQHCDQLARGLSDAELVAYLPAACECVKEIRSRVDDVQKELRDVATEADMLRDGMPTVSLVDRAQCDQWAQKLRRFLRVAAAAGTNMGEPVALAVEKFLMASHAQVAEQVRHLEACSPSLAPPILVAAKATLPSLLGLCRQVLARASKPENIATDLEQLVANIDATVQRHFAEAEEKLRHEPVEWAFVARVHSTLNTLKGSHDHCNQLTRRVDEYCVAVSGAIATAMNLDDKAKARLGVERLFMAKSAHQHSALNAGAPRELDKLVATVVRAVEAKIPPKNDPSVTQMGVDGDKRFLSVVMAAYRPFEVCKGLLRDADSKIHAELNALFLDRGAAARSAGRARSDEEVYDYFADLGVLLRCSGASGCAIVDMFRDTIFLGGGGGDMLPKEPHEVAEMVKSDKYRIEKDRMVRMLGGVRSAMKTLQDECGRADVREADVLHRVKGELLGDAMFRAPILDEGTAVNFIAKLGFVFWMRSMPDVARKKRKTPHLVQIFSVLRMLGWDCANTATKNHIVEVPTGEGKSIVLGITAAAQAVRGFTVHCVCYSQYLCRRDRKDMLAFHKALGIEGQIKYQTFDELCEGFVGDVRAAAIDVLTGGTTSVKAREPLAKEKRMLLVDEVDVFFTKRFFGNTYNAAAILQSPLITAFIEHVWAHRTQSPAELHAHPLVAEIKEKLPLAAKIIDWGVSQLIANCNRVETRLKYVKSDEDPSRLVYKDSWGNVNKHITFPNQTIYAYFHEVANRLISRGYMEKLLGIIFFVGRFSYAALVKQSFGTICGVTGTLSCLHDKQKEALRAEFGIERLTYVGSVFDKIKGHFRFDDKYVTLAGTKDEWNRAVTRKVQDAWQNKQPVMVYFKNGACMREFHSEFLRQCREGDNLPPNVTLVERDCPEVLVQNAVDQAGYPGTITFLTRIHGRGLDVVPHKDCEAAGILVIQTFYSTTASEEVQVMGRSGRRGKAGRYELVLAATSMGSQKLALSLPKGGSTPIDGKLLSMLADARGTATMTKQASMNEEMKGVRHKHDAAWALVEGDKCLTGSAPTTAKIALLEKQCFHGATATLDRNRHVFMVLDATGSMRGPRWAQLAAAVREYTTECAKARSEAEQRTRIYFSAYACSNTTGYIPVLQERSLFEAKTVDISGSRTFGDGGTNFQIGFSECLSYMNKVVLKDPTAEFCILWLTDGNEPPGTDAIRQICAAHESRIVHYKQFIYDCGDRIPPAAAQHLQAFAAGIGTERCEEYQVLSAGTRSGAVDIRDAFRAAAVDEPVFLRLD